jgi:hypothetical protein
MTKTTTKSLDLKRRLREARTDEERQALLDGLPHEVGFAKPPKSTQFKPGQSGNPKGRPKGSRNFGLMMAEAFDQQVEVTENGRRRKRSKGEVAVLQVVNKAAAGDLKAFAASTDLMRKTGQLDGPPVAQEMIFDPQALKAGEAVIQFYSQGESDDTEGEVQ